MARKDSEDVKRIREIMKSIPRCAMGSTNADKVQILLEEIMYYCLNKGIDYGHASFLAEEEFGKMTGEEFTDYRETRRLTPAAATQDASALSTYSEYMTARINAATTAADFNQLKADIYNLDAAMASRIEKQMRDKANSLGFFLDHLTGWYK